MFHQTAKVYLSTDCWLLPGFSFSKFSLLSDSVVYYMLLCSDGWLNQEADSITCCDSLYVPKHFLVLQLFLHSHQVAFVMLFGTSSSGSCVIIFVRVACDQSAVSQQCQLLPSIKDRYMPGQHV